MGDLISRQLIKKYGLISDQISSDRLLLVLSELESNLVKGVRGNVVEFGCYSGTTSLYIRRLLDAYNQFLSREFHVYDSFEGLPEKTEQDNSPAGAQFKSGELYVTKKQLINNFAKSGLKPPVIHKSWFKDLKADSVPDNIAFAFIDGDFYSSTADSLKLIYPKMVDNAVIVIDDYKRVELPGVEKAVSEFTKKAKFKSIRFQNRLAIIKI